MLDVSTQEAALRIALALLLGSLLGVEREWRSKPAGLRTHALVCEGAALFMLAGIQIYVNVHASGGTNADPGRIASTIVQGIGFLAGGAVFIAGSRVKGLTTAATIWVTAAIGLLVGAGIYDIGILGAIGALVTLTFLRAVEKRMPTSDDYDDHTHTPRRNKPAPAVAVPRDDHE
jgi:putative Mg2+ transporter-C (MgtC) family protein